MTRRMNVDFEQSEVAGTLKEVEIESEFQREDQDDRGGPGGDDDESHSKEGESANLPAQRLPSNPSQVPAGFLAVAGLLLVNQLRMQHILTEWLSPQDDTPMKMIALLKEKGIEKSATAREKRELLYGLDKDSANPHELFLPNLAGTTSCGGQ